MGCDTEKVIASIHDFGASEWTAVITAIALFVAIGFQIVEWKRSTKALGLETLMKLGDSFDTADFRKIRSNAAVYLQNKKNTHDSGYAAVLSVLNFFEGVAYAQSKGIVSSEAVWHFFGYSLLPFCAAANQLILEKQRDDPDSFTDLMSLCKDVREMKFKKNALNALTHVEGDEAVRRFLSREISHSQP